MKTINNILFGAGNALIWVNVFLPTKFLDPLSIFLISFGVILIVVGIVLNAISNSKKLKIIKGDR